MDQSLNLATLKGWKRRGLAMLLGIFAALALPPFYLLILLVPSFSGLFLLIYSARNGWAAFRVGWWWGLGCFTAGLYWICISLFVEPDKFAWLTPFALFGLPSIVAIYIGMVAGVTKRLWKLPPHIMPMVFAAVFIAAEYLRTYLFSGFPWNLTGYVWTVSDVTLQAAYMVGIYGLGFLAVFIATAPALLILKDRPLFPGTLAVFMLVAMVAYGAIRLEHNPTRYSDVKIRIIQPDIAQSLKWNREARFDILKKLAELTVSQGIQQVKLVIWPEAAIPYYITPDSVLLHHIGAILPQGTLLAAGGVRSVSTDTDWKAWNSLFVINHDGKLISQYDKHHIVPFGEFIPLRGILPVENIAGGLGDFSRGMGPQTIESDAIPPFSPLICYEAIFPAEATDGSGQAKWLLNITNDAWFGVSSGPYQHLQMARVRAVENGLPLVRAANTGISAVIDPYGRILNILPLNRIGIIDFYLPLPKS